jgi:hypothetical protein
VGCGGRSLPPWATTPDVHLSKILIRPFIFRKSRQNKYKKILCGVAIYVEKSQSGVAAQLCARRIQADAGLDR